MSTPVLVAGGAELTSSVMMLQAPWSVGDCTFQSDFRVMPLGSFDVVIGMDWLAAHSSMQVHWQEKLLAIPYQGKLTVLQGLPTSTLAQLLLHISAIDIADDTEPTDCICQWSYSPYWRNLLTCFRLPHHYLLPEHVITKLC